MKLKRRPNPARQIPGGKSWIKERATAMELATATEFDLPPSLDDQLECDVDGVTDVAFRERDRQQPSSSVALLDNASASLGDADFALQLEPVEWHVSDNYQVALVPPGNKADWAGKTSNAPLEMKPILVLPLTWRELLVRLRVGVDPSDSGRESCVVRFGEVFADFSSREVSRSEENVALTSMEFKLLRFLVQNAGRVISRDEMLNKVWGYERYPCTRTVDNHILRLRQKLELDPARPIHFHTVHGVGYKFVLDPNRVVVEQKM